MKTNKELREIAKEALVDALAKAYYDISDNSDAHGLTEEEAQEVIAYMSTYGATMCKAIRKEYYTM